MSVYRLKGVVAITVALTSLTFQIVFRGSRTHGPKPRRR